MSYTPVVAVVLGLALAWPAVLLIEANLSGERACEVFPARRRTVSVVTALVLAVVYFLIASRLGLSWVTVSYAVATFGLVVVSIVDIFDGRIPTRVVYPTLLATLLFMLIQAGASNSWGSMLRAGVVALVAAGFLFVIHLVSPNGMGMGDVRLELVAGLIMGWQYQGALLALIGLLLSFFVASLVGLTKAARANTGRRTILRFGPYLSAGAIMIMLFGQALQSTLLGH